MFQVGAITDRCGAVDGFALNAYSSKAEIGEHFDSTSYSDYSTLLRKLTTTAYSSSNGGRSGARKIAVLVLTGKIRNADEIITLAQRAKNSGVEIYVVTVGKTDIEIANAISTRTSWKHVYSYGSYAELRNVGSELSRVICTCEFNFTVSSCIDACTSFAYGTW